MCWHDRYFYGVQKFNLNEDYQEDIYLLWTNCFFRDYADDFSFFLALHQV